MSINPDPTVFFDRRFRSFKCHIDVWDPSYKHQLPMRKYLTKCGVPKLKNDI